MNSNTVNPIPRFDNIVHSQSYQLSGPGHRNIYTFNLQRFYNLFEIRIFPPKPHPILDPQRLLDNFYNPNANFGEIVRDLSSQNFFSKGGSWQETMTC